ncbi:MAG: hypothetical protein K2J80_10990 [Oscillospiraceae bacterium]|nr:hypothetical protein [Oscillospiraceae bacterium]
MDKPHNPTIKIGKKETTTDLLEKKPEDVKYLCVYANNKKADLDFLKEYPNVETLFVNGDLANVDGISELKRLNRLTLLLPAEINLSEVKVPTLKSLSVYKQINPGFSALLTDKIEYLELMDMRKLSDLSFVEQAEGLKKLYLMSLPAVDVLPEFGKLPNLYGLKLYELHKLNDIESLARSNIRYLDFALVADKLTGTKIANVLLRMKDLEWASMRLDRSSDRRYNVLENQLKKAGKEQLLDVYCDMNKWLTL